MAIAPSDISAHRRKQSEGSGETEALEHHSYIAYSWGEQWHVQLELSGSGSWVRGGEGKNKIIQCFVHPFKFFSQQSNSKILTCIFFCHLFCKFFKNVVILGLWTLMRKPRTRNVNRSATALILKTITITLLGNRAKQLQILELSHSYTAPNFPLWWLWQVNQFWRDSLHEPSPLWIEQLPSDVDRAVIALPLTSNTLAQKYCILYYVTLFTAWLKIMGCSITAGEGLQQFKQYVTGTPAMKPKWGHFGWPAGLFLVESNHFSIPSSFISVVHKSSLCPRLGKTKESKQTNRIQNAAN